MKTILLSAAFLTYGFLGAQVKSSEKQIIVDGKDSTSIIKEVLEGDLKRQIIIQTADTSIMTIEDLIDGSQKQTIIQGGDTTIIITEKFEENFNIDELGDILLDDKIDSTKIKLGKMKIVIVEDKNKNKKGEKKIIIDEDVTEKDEFENEDDSDEDDFAHWSGFGIFANGFLNNTNQIARKEDAPFLELDYARSIGLQFNLVEKRFPIVKEYVGLTTGLGFQWNRYMLNKDVNLMANQDSTYGISNGSIDYQKNVLRSTYLQAPLLIEFNTNKNNDESWHFSLGVVGGIRIGSSWKTKWEDDEKTRREKVKSNFNLNPFQAYATAIVGFEDINIYVNYGLTQVFDKGKGPKFSPVNAGLLFNF